MISDIIQNTKNEEEKNLSPVLQIWLAATILVSAVVFTLKYIAYNYTNSIAFYSDAMESIVNIIISIIALWSIRISLLPADKNHPYGHNKAEYFSAVIEGFLIMLSAGFILYHLYSTSSNNPQPILINKGFLYNLLACFIQLVWGALIFLQANYHKSISLRAEAVHLLTDFATTSGVLIGVFIACYQQNYKIDIIIAILIAINIAWQGFELIRKSSAGLMDHSVDSESFDKIKYIIAHNASNALEVHDLKTRMAGYAIFIEFHLVVDSNMSVRVAHNICDELEFALKKEFNNARITIHVEPQEEAKLRSHNNVIPVI